MPLPGENVPYFSLPSRRGKVSSNCDMHRGLDLRFNLFVTFYSALKVGAFVLSVESCRYMQ